MRYKILLTGKNKAVIDDFFLHMMEDFEAQTTSVRYMDIMNHLKYFEPNAVVVCLHHETEEGISAIGAFRGRLEERRIPLIIIGNQDECKDFEKSSFRMNDFVITKPVSVHSIRDRIVTFLDDWYPKEENAPQVTEESVRAQVAAAINNKPVQNEEEEKKHILVVDDDPLMLKMIKEQLKDKYQVGTALSGAIALKFLENKKTDLIILDYEMPRENGAQVLERIRENEQLAKLPVIFLTGINDGPKIRQVLSMKPQGYLLKPLERDKLLGTIEKALE